MINTRKIFSITRMVRRAFWGYKYQLLMMTGLGLVSGFFASIGIGAAIPLFSLATGQTIPGTDFATRTVTGVLHFLHLPVHPAFLMLLIVVFFIGKAFATFYAKFTSDRIVARYVFQQQKTLFGQATNASWPYLLDQKVGYLERVLLFDIPNGAGILGNVSSTILILTSFLMYASVAISISLKITLLTLAFGGISFFLTKPIFYRTRKLFEMVSAMQKTMGHYVAQSTIGAKVVKIMGSQDAVTETGSLYFNQLRHSSVMGSFYSYLVYSFFEPAVYVFIAVLFLISYRTPGFNIAAFAVVIYLVQKMFGFTQSIQSQIQNISGATPYLRTALKQQEITSQHSEADTGSAPFTFSRALSFEGVSFSYKEKQDVLSDISFTIPRGAMFGIIGPSGGGKTTLVDLLLRLFEPTAGSITIDGTDIRSVHLTQWRRHIGYVTQETFLLNDTVEQNIRFYDEHIDDATIQKAIQSAQLSDVIADLPDGLQTVVGERGVKLSGGQRQRIALARALARKPDILVLDEATSSLDTASEELIQRAIHDLRGNITIIVIAHRLSTIMKADHIISLDHGHIINEGAPESVIERAIP